MTIAVHIDVSGHAEDLAHHFSFSCFTLLAEQHPGEHFIFIYDRPGVFPATLPGNITMVLLGPLVKNRLSLFYWYNFKLPELLKRYNANVFISKDVVLSKQISIAQCMVIHDLSFLAKGPAFGGSEATYRKKNFSAFAARANKIILSNTFIAAELVKKYPSISDKVYTTGPILPAIYRPRDFNEQTATRQSYTDGKDYFLFFVTANTWANTIILLKAFSIFKKWQKSNMQVVLLFDNAQKGKQVKDLDRYKYREDTRLICPETAEARAALIASAYAAIYLPAEERYEHWGIAAEASLVPLISRETAFCRAVYADAALYCQLDEQRLSEKMITLYKDENLRNQFIATAGSRISRYAEKNALDMLWAALLDSLDT